MNVDDRLAALRARFVERSKREATSLHRALDDLAAGAAPDLQEMRRIAHVMSGTAGTFGYNRLGTAAEAFESTLVASPGDLDRVLRAGRQLLQELALLNHDNQS